MNQDKVNQFWGFYKEALERQVRKNPHLYSYPIEKVPEVVAKMQTAYAQGAFKITLGPAWKIAAKQMGFTSSQKLWNELYGD